MCNHESPNLQPASPGFSANTFTPYIISLCASQGLRHRQARRQALQGPHQMDHRAGVGAPAQERQVHPDCKLVEGRGYSSQLGCMGARCTRFDLIAIASWLTTMLSLLFLPLPRPSDLGCGPPPMRSELQWSHSVNRLSALGRPRLALQWFPGSHHQSLVRHQWQAGAHAGRPCSLGQHHRAQHRLCHQNWGV